MFKILHPFTQPGWPPQTHTILPMAVCAPGRGARVTDPEVRRSDPGNPSHMLGIKHCFFVVSEDTTKYLIKTNRKLLIPKLRVQDFIQG